MAGPQHAGVKILDNSSDGRDADCHHTQTLNDDGKKDEVKVTARSVRFSDDAIALYED